ncbi:GGDEF domain-containing protein [Paenibacillus abyssi]|uniref:GGDEF domain-containing protein n=1 Tax=Paenibacillus abyssi TaxID=1340531 RepID=A0A917G7G2_9BACL|nr:GGDEF domain-containing protein [Paenibacillus abyssi]
MLILACTYLYTGLIIIPHILTFPGVFSDTGLLGAGNQSAVWLWVFWHGGFPIGIIAYLLVDQLDRQEDPPQRVIPLAAGMVTVTILIVLLWYVLSTMGNDWLPAIIEKNNYSILLTSGVGAVVWLLNCSAFILLIWLRRGKNVLTLWLTVAVFAFLLDVTVTLFAGARYSLGWYTARLNSLVAATVVICSIIYEVNKLYIRLVKQHVQLVESQDELRSANEKLTKLSNLDGLTGIPNRRRFDEMLARELHESAGKNSPLSLLMLDIDCFKTYNDHYGHLGGDAVLKRVALIIEDSLTGTTGIAARYGGEEFAVILPRLDVEHTQRIGERIRAAVEAEQILHKASIVGNFITVSIGAFTMLPAQNTEFEEMVAFADQALYSSKSDGRNRVTAFDQLLNR